MYKRFALLTLACLTIVSLVAPNLVRAQDGSGQNKPIYLTWDDAPNTTRIRHVADAQVRWGWEGSEKLGPFVVDPYHIGDSETFILDSARDTLHVELLYVSDYAYFWFEPDANFSPAQLQEIGQRFDQEIWQLMQYIYGENIPNGIDGDPRVHLVHITNLFPFYAGFFSPDDQCSHDICAQSNERDVLYLMTDNVPFGSDSYLATVAHELQHLIQFQADGNEYRWLDEGISQLLEHLNGYRDDSINQENVWTFLEYPNHPLNRWTVQMGATSNYYGAGYLFTLYLYERFELSFIQALMQSPFDGLAAVNHVLQTTGQDVALDELISDWQLTNYIDNAYVDDGRYYYSTYDLPSTVYTTALNFRNARATSRGEIEQYGAEYLSIVEAGTYEISFDGQAEAKLMPIAPYEGNAMWWSYNATASVTSLTRTVDLSDLDSATLQYHLWWDTGDFPAYMHVLASTDEGMTWETLEGKRMVRRSAYDDAPAHHYAGRSGRWVEDLIDLTEFTGQDVQIRFEYITNNAVTSSGFALDNIEIPELGWLDDVEAGNNGWVVDGFLRTGQMVVQNWAVNVVTNEEIPQIFPVTIDAGLGTATVTIPDGGGVVILGAFAPLTNEVALYDLDMTMVE